MANNAKYGKELIKGEDPEQEVKMTIWLETRG
jgi:hypothetical protein